MEYIHTALLLNKLGKHVNEVNVKKVLEAAGAHVEEAKVKALVTSLEGIDMEKVIKEASVMPTVAVAAPQAGTQEAKKEEKKDDKKSEEAAAAGLSSLFG